MFIAGHKIVSILCGDDVVGIGDDDEMISLINDSL